MILKFVDWMFIFGPYSLNRHLFGLNDEKNG